MNNVCIKLKDINLNYPSAPYNATTIKESFFHFIKRDKSIGIIKDVHALKNINLNINEGERVGIIGSNGAGKSTLLKLIAGIYPPASGQMEVNGNIQSLFELSLGFDLYATGRENIYYRSFLLGNTPKIVNENIENIINFADLGEFINYPIRTYSAGMMMRLAFAVSTTLNGDILLLDEAIGAGDAAFMVKAKKRINEMVEKSKILILVSHDMLTVKQICSRVIWLKNGEIFEDGKSEDVVKKYLDYVL
ncbi:MAG: ABC transporter ATP-binding protein [Tissierellia bacterium]|nr:ABC transporter ATP-binding protein [Tissierellia bacterium]